MSMKRTSRSSSSSSSSSSSTATESSVLSLSFPPGGDFEVEEDDFDFRLADDGDGFFEAPASILEAFKAVDIEESTLPIAFAKEEVPEDTMVVNADPSNFLEMKKLSEIAAIRDSGEFFIDSEVPLDFAISLQNSPFPLLTDRQLVDCNSIHKSSAKAAILYGVATWEILARQIKVFEESEGRTPPSFELTVAEQLTGITGGVYE